MMESDFFRYIAQDLCIFKGSNESLEQWHCRIAYSAAAVRGLTSLWELEEGCDKNSVSLIHVTDTISQTLNSFRKLFPYVEELLKSFEEKAKVELAEQIRITLQNGGCFYHKTNRIAPVIPSSASDGEILFLRGVSPAKLCPISGAGFYNKCCDEKTDQDVSSMFGLQALLTEPQLNKFEASINEDFRTSLDGWEFLCRNLLHIKHGFWKDAPDKNYLSLMRRKEGNRTYALYRFDGKTFSCRYLPDYWNVRNRYALLALSLLARNRIPPFEVKQCGEITYIKPGYIMPPAEYAFFLLYSWPDFDSSLQKQGVFAPRIMSSDVYKAFQNVMTRLGYRFTEKSYV